MSGLRINVERMRARFETLATFGGTPDGGVNRPSFSEADLQARRWLREEMSLLGMEACGGFPKIGVPFLGPSY